MSVEIAMRFIRLVGRSKIITIFNSGYVAILERIYLKTFTIHTKNILLQPQYFCNDSNQP